MQLTPFKIGNLTIETPLILAPMAGVTNHAFRIMCKSAGGCGLVYTEMFSAYAIKFRDPGVKSMIDWTDEERPVAAQVFGGDPETVAVAARAMEEAGADLVDINFGCPVPKVAKSGSGASLLKNLGLAREILIAARAAVKIPLTIKARTGWNLNDTSVIDLAKTAEICGIDAISVHGRAACQGYSGTADWSIIARVKESVGIPVIANGDVNSPESAVRMFETTGCDGVMIGRAALGNPWIFRRISEFIDKGAMLPAPSALQKLDAATTHAELLRAILGEKRAAKEMRGHLCWYLKGLAGGPKLRDRLMRTGSIEEIKEVLDEARCRCEFGLVEARQRVS